MSIQTVLTAAQQRVENDKTALKNGSAAAADLPAAQAVVDSIAEVQSLYQSQSSAANTRYNAAKTAANGATATIGSLSAQLAAAPFNLTAAKEKKLSDAVDATTYKTDFDNVQSSMTQLATDHFNAATARIDLEASQKNVRARVNALLQWVAIAETALNQVSPLLQQATIAVGANDLATAWWAITQAKAYLAVVTDTKISTAVSNAVSDLGNEVDDFATKLDAALKADDAVVAEEAKLAGRQATLAATKTGAATALAALVSAGL